MKKNWFQITFLTSLVVNIAAAYMVLNNITGSAILFLLGLTSTLAFIIIGIYEVNNSNKIQQTTKVRWTLGFLFFNFITSLLYLFKRKGII